MTQSSLKKIYIYIYLLSPIYIILVHFTRPHESSIHTQRIDTIHLNNRLLDRSWPTTQITFMQHANGWHFIAMIYCNCLISEFSFYHYIIFHGNRDSSVGVATRLMAKPPGFDPWQGKETFLFSLGSRPALKPTEPPIQWVSRALSPGTKRQGRKADHSAKSSAEVKIAGAIPSLPHMLSRHSV
jgi:hypothetical protein